MLEAPQELLSGVFERELAPQSETTDRGFTSPELGNIMTGFEANVDWLESIFTTEFPREDILEALRDVRESQERLLRYCREAAVLAGEVDLLPLHMSFRSLLNQALEGLTARLGAPPALEVVEIPEASVNVDRALMQCALEHIVYTALQLTKRGMRTELRGFLEGNTLHFLAMAVGEEDGSSPTIEDEALNPLLGTPIRFSVRVARAHGGKLTVRETPSSTVLHLSLTRRRLADDPWEEEVE